MRTRAARWWLVLAGVAAVAAATADGSRAALVAGGLACMACGAVVIALDSQRKRGGTRR